MKNTMLAPLLIAALLALMPAHSATMPIPLTTEVPDILLITDEHGEPLAGTHISLPFDVTTGRFQTLEIPFRVFSNAMGGKYAITISSFRNPIIRAGAQQIELVVRFEGPNLSMAFNTKPHQDLYPNVVVTRAGTLSRLLKLTVEHAGSALPKVGRYTGKFTLTVTHQL